MARGLPGFPILAIIFMFLFLYTCWLGWQNRSSEAILSKVIPAMAVGVVGALATMLFSLKGETREVEFPAVFIFNADSKEPLSLPVPASLGPDSYFAWRYVKAEIEKNPSLLGDKSGDPGALYFEVLLRMVLDVLFELYNGHWDVEFRALDLPYVTSKMSWTQESAQKQEEFITLEDIKKWFPDARILDITNPPFEKIAVPPRTIVSGETDFTKGDPATPFLRKLSIRNPFVEIHISLTRSGGRRGLGGLAHLLGYSQEDDYRFWTALYVVQLSAKFEAFRSGHPDMAKYRRWVDIMFDRLQTELDARGHWELTKEQFLLFRDREEKTVQKESE
ncbi:MAG TPA: hypothetical protein VGX03_10680 [Candidatus Binatia bacterium]|nr:hypothetical protein [Candidatus Binatia bacterium]